MPVFSSQDVSATKAPPQMRLISTAFVDGGTIPTRYTADGENVSPPLRWTDPPPSTKSFAVVCEDVDAPSGLLVHWLAWNLRVDERELFEGVVPAAEAYGVRQGENDFHRAGYFGPKPPPGKPHRYVFRLYALDHRPEVRPGATRAELDRALDGHILDEGVLVGIYGRNGRRSETKEESSHAEEGNPTPRATGQGRREGPDDSSR